jgi:hypothetical protein
VVGLTIDHYSAEMETKHILNRLRKAAAHQRALIGGLLGALSALLSTYPETPDYLVVLNTPLPPAFWFGMVLCTSVALWESRALFILFAIMLTSFIAWAAAIQASVYIHDAINSQVRTEINYLFAICGIAGGFVGSTIVVFGLSALSRGFRTSGGWSRTILLGTLAGLFLEFDDGSSQQGLPIHIGSILPLFVVWQTSVAASIAYSLGKPALAVQPSAFASK